MKRVHTTCLSATLGCGLLLIAPLAQAVDWSTSGFGTLGYAISDQSYNYQRFINDDGTFKRDSVLGGQLDLKLDRKWSATAQLTVMPSLRSDEVWALQPSWLFVSWRPGNDWLVRAGKQRIPFYLNAENRYVGQTYDFVRQPAEVYAMAPNNDCTGLFVSHNWQPDAGELTLDMFAGRGTLDGRAYGRDYGVYFVKLKTSITGAVMTLRQEKATWRLALHHVATRSGEGNDLPVRFSYVTLPSGDSYYQVGNHFIGPGVEGTRSIFNEVIMLGGDVELAPGWQLLGELARNIQRKSDLGVNTVAGYAALLHKIDRFTPYVSAAKLRSLGAPLRTVEALDATQVSSSLATADLINASQRMAADSQPVYDQASLAIGSSYALTAQSKLKAEWMRTDIGKRSAMVDQPAEGVVRYQHINVFSVNYNFVF